MASTVTNNVRTATFRRAKKRTTELTPEQQKFAAGLQSKSARSPGSLYYGRQRLLKTGYSGYGPETEAQMRAGTLGTSRSGTTPSVTAPEVYTPLQGTAPGPSNETAALTPQDEAAMKLAAALRGQGMNWNYTPGQSYAPSAAAVGGTAWKRIQNMPSLYTLMFQAAQASGTPMADYLAEIQQYQHGAPSYPFASYRLR